MFDKITLHSLNKNDPLALVYFDAFGNVIRLTEKDFASRKEFRKWKNWMNMKCHSEEKRELRYRKRITLISFDDASIAEHAIPDHATLMLEIEERKARNELKDQMRIGFYTCLTEGQQHRLWENAVEGVSTWKIAEKECATHQSVCESIERAKKNILKFLRKSPCQSVILATYSEGVIN